MAQTYANPQLSPAQKKNSPHLRLTTEQVKHHWLLGDYSATGYLATLFAAMKREGLDIVIRSISDFCQQWSIGERRFYRAKAKLIREGRLEERIQESLIVRIVTHSETTDSSVIETDSSVIETDSSVIETDSSVIETDSHVIETTSIANQDKESVTSPDLFQIISDQNSLSLSNPPPTQPEERENSENLFTEENEPIDEYREWLIRTAQKLPKAIGIMELWIEKNAIKTSLQKAFLKYKESFSKGSNLPRNLATEEKSPTEAEVRAGNLARLKARLRLYPQTRQATIAEATGYGFIVTEQGIEDPQTILTLPTIDIPGVWNGLPAG